MCMLFVLCMCCLYVVCVACMCCVCHLSIVCVYYACCICVVCMLYVYCMNVVCILSLCCVNSILVLQSFTTARKSGNIILTSVCRNNVAAFSCCLYVVSVLSVLCIGICACSSGMQPRASPTLSLLHCIT